MRKKLATPSGASLKSLLLLVPPLATDLFDYQLALDRIAQVPASQRDQSRLLVVDRATRRISHTTFSELPRFLSAGDTLFRNNAAVLPARLYAHRPTGGQVECFLLRPGQDETTWRCLIRPARKLPIGATFAHAEGAFSGEILAKEPDGTAWVRFLTATKEPIARIALEFGDVPLPPYIRRATKSSLEERGTQRRLDVDRYQTVYANASRQVAVAAPTAGLHFTSGLLAQLARNGIRTADITLHVGLGTFKPIATPTIEEHPIHREIYEISANTQRALFPPLGGRRVAVGTTTVRTIEDFLDVHTAPGAHDHVAEAGIFIYPPRNFRGVDALITNFHQPRSTLLCLVASFLTPGTTEGIAWIQEIYAEAIAAEYRFLSYGDAMLIL